MVATEVRFLLTQLIDKLRNKINTRKNQTMQRQSFGFKQNKAKTFKKMHLNVK